MGIGKKRAAKIVSIALIIALLVSTVGIMSFAAGKNSGKAGKNDVKGISDMLSMANASGKDETVYVIADAEGAPEKIIVSEWLKNPEKADELKDKSDLKDIENVEGNESYTMNPDNMLVWDAKGKDIHYQGKSDKPLPVDLKVTYKLDGENISPKKLAGKSGKVTIRFDYTNNQYQMVNIDGTQTKIYVPFTMMTGMVLPNKNFSNIKVTNGKMVNDGGKTMVMGFALPGMQENLGVNRNEFDIPSYVEITADVKNFKLETTMTMCSNEMFNNVDMSSVSSVDDLKSKISQFADASKQLVDGSSQLYAGMTTMLNKSDQLIEGIKQLHQGSEALAQGTGQFSEGTDQLQQGILQLNQGLEQLISNNDKLNDGADQVFNSLLTMAQAQIENQTGGAITVPQLTQDNYEQVLSGIMSKLSPDQIEAVVKAKVEQTIRAEYTDKITAGVQAAVQAKVLEGVLKAAGVPMTADQWQQAVAAGAVPQEQVEQVNGAVNQQMASDAIKAQISQQVESVIGQKITEYMNSAEGQAQLAAAQKNGEQGIAGIKTLLAGLNSYKEFATGLKSYTAGVMQVYQGSEELKKGGNQISEKSKELSEGAKKLNSGVATMDENSGKLKDGVKQLQQGSMQLSEGMKKFNDEGVAKIMSIFDGKLGNVAARLKATVDVSRNYTNYAGIQDGTKGNVKFIYKTEEIMPKKD